MSEPKYWKMIRIPDDERITLDIASLYEIGSIFSSRINQIGKGDRIYLEMDDFLVDTKDIKKTIKIEVAENDIVKNNGATYIKINTTPDIVKAELNNKKCPYAIIRVISSDPQTLTMYYELVDVNQLAKPLFMYLG